MRAFEQPGGAALHKWLNRCDNATFSALTFRGGSAWREAMLRDAPAFGEQARALKALVERHSDEELHVLMTDLGGHCFETLLEAFEHAASTDRRTVFIAYTVKGHGLPLAGHRDNHGLFLAPAQVDALRARLGLSAADEWEPFSALVDGQIARQLLEAAPINRVPTRSHGLAERVDVPLDLAPTVGGALAKPTSTQAAFGNVLKAVAQSEAPLADRIVTACPDVTTTTGLSGFVNKRGVFTTGRAHADPFKTARAHSLTNWATRSDGQHIELGIAENNLCLLLAAMGLSAPLFGQRLFPIGAGARRERAAPHRCGRAPRARCAAPHRAAVLLTRVSPHTRRTGTLYDPFVSRALDSLNYACYMDSRFMLVGTPSGISLAPEGGAHQSFNTPLIGMAMPNLRMYEPAFADEVKVLMRAGFECMQAPAAEGGSAVYLRLSTRVLEQPARELMTDDALRADMVAGAYWHAPPDETTTHVIAFAGAVAPEAFEAAARRGPQTALLQVTSYDALASAWQSEGERSHAHRVLERVPRDAKLVTVLDGHPAALSWLGGVCGHRVRALGVASFGQSADIVDLYRAHGIDAEAIVSACAP